MSNRWAEEANYWDTSVTPAKSQGEITEMLNDFGVENMMFAQGQVNGRLAWMIRFEWRGNNYRFTFTQLVCRLPSKQFTRSGKRITYEEQAKYQMGRIACHFVKAILTAAEAQPGALFGFLELPAATHSGPPPVASELDVSLLIDAASLLQLPEITIDR